VLKIVIRYIVSEVNKAFLRSKFLSIFFLYYSTKYLHTLFILNVLSSGFAYLFKVFLELSMPYGILFTFLELNVQS
jgi:hypothetical protein